MKLAEERPLEEALNGVNGATKAWPRKDDSTWGGHGPENTDHPSESEPFPPDEKAEPALKYFRKFDSYIPFGKFVREGMKKAQVMVKEE